MKRILEVLALGAVVAITFGAVIPEYFLVTDDLWSTQVTAAVANSMDGLGDGLYRMFFLAEGHGHFRPFQDVGYIIAYDALGWREWMRALAGFYLVLHAGSCVLLAHLLRRFRLAPSLAFLAAALFAIHPALDTNLASVQYGNNVPAFFFVLLGAATSFPDRSLSRGKAALRMMLGGFCLYVAVGYAINVAMSAPVLLGLLGFAGGFRFVREDILRLVGRGLTLVLGLGAALGHRYLSYGTLKSKIPAYTKMEPDHDVVKFAEQFYDSAIELRPDAHARYMTRLSPPGSGQYADIFRADFVSWDLAWGLFALVITGIAAALVVPRTATPAAEGTPPKPAHPLRGYVGALLFGIGLTVTHLLPYFWEIGRCSLNRYNQPAMSGLAVVIALAAGLGSIVLAPRGGPRLRGVLAVALVALPFMIWFGTSRESARSIIHGHQSVRAIVDEIVPALEAEPEIRQFYLAGHPRMTGRAGLGNTTQSKIENLVETVLGRSGVYFKQMPDVSQMGREGIEPTWFMELGPEDALPPNTALWQVSGKGLIVERIRHGSELGPTGRGEQLLLRGRHRGWGKDKGVRKGLLSSDPATAEGALRFISDVEGGRRNALALDALLEIRGDCAAPADRDLPRPRGIGTSGNRHLALSLLLEKYRNDTAKVGAEAVETFPEDEALATVALDLARGGAAKTRSADLAFAVAIHGPERFRSAAQEEFQRLTGADRDEVIRAVNDLREGRRLIADAATAVEGAKRIDAATKLLRGWKRPSTIWAVPGARARLALADEVTLAKDLPNWTKWSKRPLADELDQWTNRTSLDGAIALAVSAFDPDPETGIRTAAITVANRSDKAIATGRAFCALRLAWDLKSTDGEVLAEGRIEVPEGGLDPNRARHVYFVLPRTIPAGAVLTAEPLEYAGDSATTVIGGAR